VLERQVLKHEYYGPMSGNLPSHLLCPDILVSLRKTDIPCEEDTVWSLFPKRQLYSHSLSDIVAGRLRLLEREYRNTHLSWDFSDSIPLTHLVHLELGNILQTVA
jgi:hypothetical protein